MAKKKIQEQPEIKTVLTWTKESFKEELEKRISIGEQLFTVHLNGQEDLDALERQYQDWDDYNEELLKRAFNKDQNEYYREYSDATRWISFHDQNFKGINTHTLQYELKHIKEKIDTKNTFLKRLIEKLSLIDAPVIPSIKEPEDKIFFNKAFIVHGHNDLLKLEIARYIENDLRIKTVILHEEANRGRTIIEKFENHSKVDLAIALWTADDVGKSKKEGELKNRARQNVIFETGFFIGKLGRQRVIVIYEDTVEIPSDYSGVIFIKHSGNWKDELRKEIDAIYEIPD